MKTVQKFWDELVDLVSPWGLDNKQQREIQSLVLSGVEALPTMTTGADAALNLQDNWSLSAISTSIVSGFQFGRRSESELAGVIPVMVNVAHEALSLSTQDFMIFDGLRTNEEQHQLLKAGMTKTLQSKHLRQRDGFSHAFDAVPVVNGIPKWDWNLIYPVAHAVWRAAMDFGVADRITWGGAWDRRLSDFRDATADDFKRYVAEYQSRHKGRDFIDGPHFQWED